MLTALAKLCEQENLIGDPAFEVRPVAWTIHLSADGLRGSFVGNHYFLEVPDFSPDPKKKKSKSRELVKKFNIPRQFNPKTGGTRTSGDFAYFLVDKADYVLGCEPSSQPGHPQTDEKLRHRQQLFIKKIELCYSATNSPELLAVLIFLKRIVAEGLPFQLPEKCTANDLFAFKVDTNVEDFVHELPAVRTWWREECAPPATKADADETRWHCMIDGSPISTPALFPPVKRVPGPQKGGTPLVSYNKPAFESYGWKSSENAPIGNVAAQKIAVALSRLLDPAFELPDGTVLPIRNEIIGDATAICYWPESGSAAGDQIADNWAMLKNAESKADAGKIGDMIHSLWRGVPPSQFDTTKFYAITLTGIKGRIIVRDWYQTTVGELQESIAAYFGQLALCRNTHAAPGSPEQHAYSYASLIGTLYKAPSAKPTANDIPSRVAVGFHRAYLNKNVNFPAHLLALALCRVRAGIGDDSWAASTQRDALHALIKAILIRNHHIPIKPTASETMKEDPPHPAYLLGQLFACIERMQSLALGKNINSTVANRYFSTASSTPGIAFQRLITLYNQHYYRKALREHSGSAGRVAVANKCYHEIMKALPIDGRYPFPNKLTLKEQGLFMLGFHHQRHRFWFGAGTESPEPAPLIESTNAEA